MITQDCTSIFLDWELALWKDPVYDLAVHLHKMSYLPDEQDTPVSLWRDPLAPKYTGGWETEVQAYLIHERIKFAIVDTVRCSQAFVDPPLSPDSPQMLVGKLTTELNVYRLWGTCSQITAAEVEEVLRRPTSH